MTRLKLFLVLMTGLAASLAAGAADEDEAGAAAVGYRQAVLRVMGTNLRPLVFMAREQMPFDAEAVAMRANRIHFMTGMMEEAFTRDTSGADVDTEALDKIWSNWEDFQGKIAAVRESTGPLAEGPESFEAFRAAFSEVGRTCKSCHDEYREE